MLNFKLTKLNFKLTKWKKQLSNLLIGWAFKLDKVHLEKCSFTLDGPKISAKAYVPEDKLWHNINHNLSYWLYVGGDDEKKLEGKEVL